MRVPLALLVLAAACAPDAGVPGAAVRADGASPHEAGDAPIRVRMLVGGLHHDYDALPAELVAALASEGDLRVELVREVSAIAPAALRGVDVVFVHTCLPDAVPEEDLLSAVRAGLGLVAMHCALASFRASLWWTPMVGGFAPGHEPYATFGVELAAAHPALGGVAPAFDVTDEPYWIDDRAADALVLVQTSRPLVGADGGARAGREPLVWAREEGRGRVFASAFGHDGASQRNPEVRRLLRGGVRWAARRL